MTTHSSDSENQLEILLSGDPTSLLEENEKENFQAQEVSPEAIKAAVDDLITEHFKKELTALKGFISKRLVDVAHNNNGEIDGQNLKWEEMVISVLDVKKTVGGDARSLAQVKKSISQKITEAETSGITINGIKTPPIDPKYFEVFKLELDEFDNNIRQELGCVEGRKTILIEGMKDRLFENLFGLDVNNMVAANDYQHRIGQATRKDIIISPTLLISMLKNQHALDWLKQTNNGTAVDLFCTDIQEVTSKKRLSSTFKYGTFDKEKLTQESFQNFITAVNNNLIIQEIIVTSTEKLKDRKKITEEHIEKTIDTILSEELKEIYLKNKDIILPQINKEIEDSKETIKHESFFSTKVIRPISREIFKKKPTQDSKKKHKNKNSEDKKNKEDLSDSGSDSGSDTEQTALPLSDDFAALRDGTKPIDNQALSNDAHKFISEGYILTDSPFANSIDMPDSPSNEVKKTPDLSLAEEICNLTYNPQESLDALLQRQSSKDALDYITNNVVEIPDLSFADDLLVLIGKQEKPLDTLLKRQSSKDVVDSISNNVVEIPDPSFADDLPLLLDKHYVEQNEVDSEILSINSALNHDLPEANQISGNTSQANCDSLNIIHTSLTDEPTTPLIHNAPKKGFFSSLVTKFCGFMSAGGKFIDHAIEKVTSWLHPHDDNSSQDIIGEDSSIIE